MQPLPPVALCCITLLSLQQQLLAGPAGVRLHTYRLNSEKKQQALEEVEDMKVGPVSSHPTPPHTPLEAKRLLWRRLLFQSPPTQESGHSPAPPRVRSLRAPSGTQRHRRRSRRERRQSNSALRGHQHAQLMRVGCVLGTCQVQNLSHRLYQLIGQSGRESSSPINPRSPHSYG
ncbi:protein ADM2-like [Brienomyrus brachyistius]|uniref:protein ADM2-like n=1 Tax=Brienomyrus brachyistius TaxID=42636 RepID=UPI0020B38DC2|nr:protein ADM2-like [Brienomyrus brachyistius]XP_048865561.1 protein ADM2-like [Brienomyrus brachyistius]XP_048865562.1 protein ADM2-like [Brienomyrus brachyistius]